MNLLAILDSIRRWVWLALLAVVIVLGASTFHSCRRAGDAESALRAAKARADLRARGDIPVEPVEDVNPALNDALTDNAVLRGQVEKLRKDLAGAKGQLLVQARTKPTPITAAPRPPPSPGTAAPPCYLALGDALQLRLQMAILRGKDQVAGVAGVMEAWAQRAGEPEPVLLLREPFEEKLTTAIEQAQPPERNPGWAFGPAAGINVRGWQAGLALAPPPLRLFWGLEGELVAQGLAGPGGFQATAAALVRRR